MNRGGEKVFLVFRLLQELESFISGDGEQRKGFLEKNRKMKINYETVRLAVNLSVSLPQQ